MIRVLVVDDHPIFCDGLRTALAELTDIEVCGEAGSAAAALELVVSLVPDVVLMDLELGDGSGIDVTAQITRELPGVAVVVLTMHDAEASVFAALCAGAVGYLLKGVDQDALERAVRAAGAGEAVFGAGVARRVLMRLGDAREVTTPGPSGLTSRETEILDLMAEGWGNPEISERLFLSPKTVRNNVSTILTKLHAASRGDAIVQARGWGYGGRGGSRP